MTDKTPKEKVTDFLLAIIGMVLIFACLAMLPKAWEKEEAFKMERQDAFLADAQKQGEVK